MASLADARDRGDVVLGAGALNQSDEIKVVIGVEEAGVNLGCTT
jgi:hypothetical protein